MMVCQSCYRHGYVRKLELYRFGLVVCRECQGCGIVSCCDTAGAEGDPSDLATTLPDEAEKAAGAPSERDFGHG